MKKHPRITESELYALMEQCPYYQAGPKLQLQDLEMIGFVVTREQSTSNPTENMPQIGQILAVAPIIEPMSFVKVMYHLNKGSTVPLDHAAFSKLVKVFESDKRYADHQLETVAMDATSTSIRMVRKEVQP